MALSGPSNSGVWASCYTGPGDFGGLGVDDQLRGAQYHPHLAADQVHQDRLMAAAASKALPAVGVAAHYESFRRGSSSVRQAEPMLGAIDARRA